MARITHPQTIYHHSMLFWSTDLGKPIQMNLFCGQDTRVRKDKDDPAFIISDTDDLSELIFRKRMQIERVRFKIVKVERI